MGSRDATSAIRRSDGAELTVAREIMNLLARTAEIQSQGHDGRVTMSKFLAVDGMRDFLVSAYGLSSSGILSHVNQEYLPKLAVLVTIASVSKQPLHRVILGRVGNWKGCGVNSSQISIREKRVRKDWKAIEIQLGAIARGRDFVNFENSCKKLNVSMSSVRRRFPHLVAKIAARGLKLRRDNAISRKKEMLNRVKNAFRVLVSNGEYPSWRRLQDVTGVNIRNVNIKSLLDREWIRIEGVTDMRRRKRSSSPSTD